MSSNSDKIPWLTQGTLGFVKSQDVHLFAKVKKRKSPNPPRKRQRKRQIEMNLGLVDTPLGNKVITDAAKRQRYREQNNQENTITIRMQSKISQQQNKRAHHKKPGKIIYHIPLHPSTTTEEKQEQQYLQEKAEPNREIVSIDDIRESYNTTEAAMYITKMGIPITEGTLRNNRNKPGYLIYFRTGKKILYRKKRIDEWMERQIKADMMTTRDPQQ